MRLASATASILLAIVGTAQAADAPAVIALARQRVEAEDSRGTGHLVRVDASGRRISNDFSIKVHWFPGVLRTLLEISASRKPGEATGQDTPVSILLEMRPDGQNTIRVFHPGEPSPALLPFGEWEEGILGSDLSYEDLLQGESYWPVQTLVKSVSCGNRHCDVVESLPGASIHSHYAKVETSFDHTIGYPILVEKSLKKAATVKDFTSLGLTQSGGIWAARQLEVKIQGRAGSTLLMVDRGSTKAHLTMQDFSLEQINRFEDR